MPLSIISVSIRHVAAVDNKCVDETYAGERTVIDL